MKRIVLPIFLIVFSATNLCAGLFYHTQPATTKIIKNEPVELYLTNTGGEAPVLEQFPDIDGLEWISKTPKSMRQQINNQVKNTNIYTFTIDKTGTVIIPELKIKIGKDKALLKDLKLTVKERKYTVSDKDGKVSDIGLDKLVYEKVIIPSLKKQYYIGEEIPLKIKVYSSTSVNFGLTEWPKVEMDKIILRDYGMSNKENRHFEKPRKVIENVDGIDYIVYVFNTSFRALAPGNLKGKVVVKSLIKIRKQRRRRSMGMFDDDFFFGSSYKKIPKTLVGDIPSVKIIPLPSIPDDSEYLGLVGNWHVSIKMNKNKLKVGDTATLKVKIKGVGTMETLSVPKLEIPGFRVYPPEIDKKYDPANRRNIADISYVMIPVEKGKNKVDVSFSVFDCVRDKYRQYKFDKEIIVEKSDKLTSTGEVFVGHQASYEPKKQEKRTFNPVILYLKRKPAGNVELPLLENHTLTYWLLIILGPVIILLSWLVGFHKQKLDNDPDLRRRRNAQASKGKVMKNLKKATNDNIDQVIQNDVVPYINDIMSLPPGTTATELAEKVDSEDLKECLKNSGTANYMPGSGHMDKNELKIRIIKAVKRLSVIILIFSIGFSAMAAEKKASSKPAEKTISSNAEALSAYDNGEFSKAAKYYSSKINPHAPDPALLYNLGNCLCQEHQYARAMVCYERAVRLKPGDSDFKENLNYVRRKLFLPEVGKVSNPIDLVLNIRDTIRPDQWLLITSTCWFLLCIAIAIRKKLKGTKWLFFSALIIVMTISATAAISQYSSTYSSDSAVVIGRHVKVYSLPSVNSGRIEFKLRNGELIRIEERRSEWIRVRAQNGEGWINSKDAALIWGDWDSKGLKKLCE